MNPDLSTITLAILAGGEGSRMGMPKGLLQLGGRPILDHLLDRLDWPGPTLLVTSPGREHPPGWQRFTAEAADPQPGLGPLRGLLTALEHAATPLAGILTVDMPLVTRSQIVDLAGELLDRPQWLGLMVERSEGGASLVEPFPCIFRSEAKEIVAAELGAGRRSVHALSRQARIGLVRPRQDWPADAWMNLNTPDDARRAGAVILP